MKKHGNDYELLLETLSRMQEEKASASLQLESLLKEIAALRESHTQQLTALRESLAMSIESMHMTISELNCRLDEKERTV